MRPFSVPVQAHPILACSNHSYNTCSYTSPEIHLYLTPEVSLLLDGSFAQLCYVIADEGSRAETSYTILMLLLMLCQMFEK